MYMRDTVYHVDNQENNNVAINIDLAAISTYYYRNNASNFAGQSTEACFYECSKLIGRG